MNELISVIVPVYNIERYLVECIESIINQTYRDLEIILVNDGSTDSSEDIMHRYAAADSRIICVNQKNGGPASARNKGLEISSGKYVIFIDSDDCLEKEMIEYLYRMMDGDVSVAVCGYHNIDEEGLPLSEDELGKKDFSEERVYSESEFWKIYFEKDVCYCVVVWNKLIRRAVIGELRFPMGRYPDYPSGRYHEDDSFITGLWRKGIVMKCSPRKLYRYRITKNGRALYISAKQHSDNIDACLDRMYYFLERKMYLEADHTYYRIMVLMSELLSMEDENNKEMIYSMLRHLRKISFRIAGCHVTIETRCKALAFAIMGRGYLMLRTLWRKSQGKDCHAD